MRRGAVALVIAWLLAMLALAHPRRVGDASEYVAMAGQLADLRPPSFTPDQLQRFTRAWAGTDAAFELETRRIPLLVGRDGRQEMPHMWLHPLLAVPGVWMARAIGLGDQWGLVALNVVLAGGLLWLAVRQGAGAWMLAIFATPLVWWLDKPLADLAIACAIGLATLAWPHPASLVVLGLAAAQNPALTIVLAIYALAALAAEPARLRSPACLGAIAVAGACAALAPAYYLWRLGRLSPLTLWTTTAYWPSAATLFYPLTDVNMGALVRFPPALALIAFAVSRRDGWRAPVARPAAASALALLVAVSQQPNQNQGGNPDLSRYALWLLPFALPWLRALDLDARPLMRVAGMAMLCVSAAWTAVAFRPTRVESYRYPTPLASWVWAARPGWTSPTPEAFAERTSHREPGWVPTATPGCEKVLLYEGTWPVSCPPDAEAPPPCRQAGVSCYANAGRDGTYTFAEAGRQAVPDVVVHDRTWTRADEVSAWVARHVAGTTSGEGDAAVARVRGTWGIGWRQAWTRPDGQLVLYARDAGRDARIALRHAVPVRITVLDPAGQVDERRATPGEAPTMVGLPPGPHVMVVVRNDEQRATRPTARSGSAPYRIVE